MKLCKTCKHNHTAMYVPFDTCCRSVRVTGIDLRNGDQVFSGWRSTKNEREPGRIMARLRQHTLCSPRRACRKAGNRFLKSTQLLILLT